MAAVAAPPTPTRSDHPLSATPFFHFNPPYLLSIIPLPTPATDDEVTAWLSASWQALLWACVDAHAPPPHPPSHTEGERPTRHFTPQAVPLDMMYRGLFEYFGRILQRLQTPPLSLSLLSFSHLQSPNEQFPPHFYFKFFSSILCTMLP